MTFDNTYYKTLLDKPWERVSAEMAAHIGGWPLEEGWLWSWRAWLRQNGCLLAGFGSSHVASCTHVPAARSPPHPHTLQPRSATGSTEWRPSFHGVPHSLSTAAGIPTDHVLPDNPTCRPFIEEYAADQQLFFRDFAAAFAKMTELGARWA